MSMPPLTERDEALIADYLADALDAPQRALVEQRLASETAFAAELRAQERLIALLRALPPRTAPRSFALTAQQAQAVPRALPRLNRPAWWGLASAAVGLLLVGGLLLISNQARPQPSAQVAAAPTQALSPAPTFTEADAAVMQLQGDLSPQGTPAPSASPVAMEQRALTTVQPQGTPTPLPSASPVPMEQRALPTQVANSADPGFGTAPQAIQSTAASMAEAEAAIMSAPAEEATPAEEAAPMLEDEGFGIMSAPSEEAAPALPPAPAQAPEAFSAGSAKSAFNLADALPALLEALLRLLVALFVPVSSSISP